MMCRADGVSVLLHKGGVLGVPTSRSSLQAVTQTPGVSWSPLPLVSTSRGTVSGTGTKPLAGLTQGSVVVLLRRPGRPTCRATRILTRTTVPTHRSFVSSEPKLSVT